jgi:hypothetical protein
MVRLFYRQVTVWLLQRAYVLGWRIPLRIAIHLLTEEDFDRLQERIRARIAMQHYKEKSDASSK